MTLPPRALRNFRRHPDKPGWWLFKERWPFGRVWEIPGSADMSGARQYFPAWHDGLDGQGDAGVVFAAAAVGGRLFLIWARRRWLDYHGTRVPRRLWRRARPSR